MRKNLLCSIVLTLTAMIGVASAATVNVTLKDNGVSNIGAPGTFYWALTNCSPGDTIAFNIAGAGPHFLLPPPTGFPLIYNKHGITIDGYTQPGASPNSNPITAANNAQIKIVIDGRNNTPGNIHATSLDYSHFDGTLAMSDPPIDNTAMATELNATSSGEFALLAIYRSTNVTVKGLAFLADNLGVVLGTGLAQAIYGVHVARDYGLDTTIKDALEYSAGESRGCHVAGCWFGVNPANPTPGGITMCLNWINFPRHQGDDGPTPAGDATRRPQLPNVGLTIGVAPGAANPRSEFNVIVGGMYHFGGEPLRLRASGNFIGMMPDGVTPIDMSTGPLADIWSQYIGSSVECGRYGENYASSPAAGKPMVIGTDGDGVNDADEGNLWGPIGGAIGKASLTQHRPALIHWYRSGNNVYLIGGNTWGIGVDGRRFTNSAFFMSGLYLDDSGDGKTKLIIGSDMASTRSAATIAAQANHFYNNWPLEAFGTPPATDGGILPFLEYENPKPTLAGAASSPNAWVSLRGNVMVGNGMAPINYADGLGTLLVGLTNFFSTYLDTNVAVIPSLNAGSVFPNLSGTFAPGVAPFTNVIIDVYQLDPEGWSIGQAFALAELTDYTTYTNGFPQGRKYLGSFPVANTGSFSITLPANADVGPGPVTVTANYSQDPAGTALGRTATSDFANPVSILPGGAESVGLTRIVPDTIVWFNSATSLPQIGGFVAANQVPLGSDVEGTSSKLGDSTFLLAASTWAADGTSMRFTSVYLPAVGGTPKFGDLFYADSGVPHTTQINNSRQSGNPGQVAGDARYGAYNFAGSGEASLWAYPAAFNSDGRFSKTWYDWSGGVFRESFVQTYSMNPVTLTQTMLSKAQDSAFGGYAPGTTPGAGASGDQLSRTGGTVAGLDNGNFVSVTEDRSRTFNPNGNASVATIFAPDGTVVKAAFKVADADQWANVGAFKGGFYVRPSGGMIYVYDNAGNLQGSLDHNATSGLAFETGRGDGTRTCSDIHSHYIFMAGRAPDNATGPVWLAVFNANTRAFVTKAVVSDTDPARHGVDRVNVACDALNRVCVTYKLKPDTTAGAFSNWQVAARVLSFDGANLSYLTHSFFPFISHDSVADVNNFVTEEPSVAMTPRQIFIYAEGVVNGANNPSQPADTAPNTHVYTVLSHPAPVAAPRPTITMTKSGSNLNLSWNPDDGLFTVQTRSSLTSGDWANATAGNVATPVSVPAGTGPLFIRLVR